MRRTRRLPREARVTDQLDALSDRLAACLDGFDVAAGSPVVLLLPRSPGAVIAMIGVLKIGAYYVPVDPAGPTAIVNEHLRGSARASY